MDHNSNNNGSSSGVDTAIPPNRVSRQLSTVDANGTATRRVPAKRPAAEPEGFNPMSILHSVRRRWLPALIIGLALGPILALAAWKFLVPQHTAVAYLRIDSVDAPLMFTTADRENAGRGAFDLYKNTQAQLIVTPFVLNKALIDDEVKALPIMKNKSDAYQWLSEELKVDFPNKGEVMAITLETPDPKSSATIVDAVIDAYMNEAVLDERNARLQRLDNLERAFGEKDSEVRARRADIRKLADTLGTSDSQSLSIAQQMAVTRFGQVQAELGKVEFDLMRAQADLDAYTQLDAKLKRDFEAATSGEMASDDATTPDNQIAIDPEAIQLQAYEIDNVLSADRQYQQIYQDLRQNREKIERMLTSYGEGMIRIERGRSERLKAELEDRRDQLVQLALAEKQRQIAVSGMTPLDPNMSPEEREAIERQNEYVLAEKNRSNLIAARKIKVDVLTKQKQRIEEDLAKLDIESKKLGRSSVDIEMMRAEIASLDDVRSRLAGEIERTKIELKNGSRISIVSNATKLSNSDDKKRLMATAGLGFLGLLLPFAAFVGLDLKKKLVSDTSSLSRETGITVLGAVPNERKVNQTVTGSSLIDGNHGNSVSSIVAMMVKMARFDDATVLMVTSAVAGEGKSTLARSLWSGLAESNYRTLLLDFDLRRPSQHQALGLEAGEGLSDILLGQTPWEDAVRQIGEFSFMLTAGSAGPVNIAAAANGRLPVLFAQLRDSYDFVIVDTPPILPVVDTRVLGEQVDSAVLSVMKDHSRVPQLIAATEVLRAHGTPLMGVVVSGCQESKSTYDYVRQ
jgi:capsular exopolysaccharide synthesis family protein